MSEPITRARIDAPINCAFMDRIAEVLEREGDANEKWRSDLAEVIAQVCAEFGAYGPNASASPPRVPVEPVPAEAPVTNVTTAIAHLERLYECGNSWKAEDARPAQYRHMFEWVQCHAQQALKHLGVDKPWPGDAQITQVGVQSGPGQPTEYERGYRAGIVEACDHFDMIRRRHRPERPAALRDAEDIVEMFQWFGRALADKPAPSDKGG